MVPALRIRKERLAPPRHPPHRAAQPSRRPGYDRLLGIVLALVPEAAAHVGRYHAKLDLLQGELIANGLAQVVRSLRRAVKRKPLGARYRHHPARLDRRSAEAVVDEFQLHAVRRIRKRSFDRGGITARPAKAF